jgi:hypothetical protein
MRGRLAHGLIWRLALAQELAADSRDRFVQRAATLLQQPGVLSTLRQRIGENVARLHLDRESIAGLESFLTRVVESGAAPSGATGAH